jgi:hypothetical protein
LGPRPEDLKPFLTSHVRECVGPRGVIGGVRVASDQVTIRGSLLRAEEKDRIESMLRFMSVLRDFRLSIDLQPYLAKVVTDRSPAAILAALDKVLAAVGFTRIKKGPAVDPPREKEHALGGKEEIQGVSVTIGDPQFTLVWHTDADLDLHVIEPGGKESYWEDPKGKLGGEIDVDNSKGFGPENIYWLTESEDAGGDKVQRPGPRGLYKWCVLYWGSFGGIPKSTRWQVRIRHAGKTSVVEGILRDLNSRSRVYT